MNFLQKHLAKIQKLFGNDWIAAYDFNTEWCAQARFTNNTTGVCFMLRGQFNDKKEIVKFHTFPILPKLQDRGYYTIEEITQGLDVPSFPTSPNYTAGIKDNKPVTLANAIIKRTINPLTSVWPHVKRYVESHRASFDKKCSVITALEAQGYKRQRGSDTLYGTDKLTLQVNNSGSLYVTDRFYATADQIERINAILAEGK